MVTVTSPSPGYTIASCTESHCPWEVLAGPASDTVTLLEVIDEHVASHRSPFGPILAGLVHRDERGSLAADVGTLLGFVALGWLAVVLWSAVLL